MSQQTFLKRETRTSFSLVGALLLTLIFGAVPQARSQDKVEAAMNSAVQYLLSTQDPATGGIHNKMRHETAMTSLSVLAMAATGHQPADPTPQGQAMKRALDYVLRPEAQDKEGYFGQTDGSRMYGHGITTLMLSEMLGMGADAAQDDLIRDRCRKAIELILRAQKVGKNENNRGGWRYAPDSGDSDMSVTVWQTMALRAAKNAGMDVPKEAIDDAVSYIRRLYQPDTEKKGAVRFGGFGYVTKGREASTTAEGLLALQVCGQYTSEEVLGTSDRLLSEGIKTGDRWFFYTTYYYAQGMYQRGGKHADEARKLVADLLLPLQSREGWWEGLQGEERQGGKVYATTLAMLSLAVRNHFLPIYQR